MKLVIPSPRGPVSSETKESDNVDPLEWSFPQIMSGPPKLGKLVKLGQGRFGDSSRSKAVLSCGYARHGKTYVQWHLAKLPKGSVQATLG